MLSPFIVRTVINPQRSTEKHLRMEKVPNIYICVKDGLDLIKQQEKEQGWKYDVIIRTRFDMDYNPDIETLIESAISKTGITINTEGVQPADAIVIAPRDMFEDFVTFALKQFVSPISELCWSDPPHGILGEYLQTHPYEKVFMGRFIRPTFKPRIAVLVCGNLRTWEKCRKDWMWDGSVDVFASTYTERYNYHPYIQSLIGTLHEKKVDSDMLSSYGFKNVVMVSSDRDMEAESLFHPQMKEIFHGYYQYSCVERGLEMIAAYEIEKGLKYDVIIRTRFDIDYAPNFGYRQGLGLVAKDSVILNQWGHQPADTFIMCKRDTLFKLSHYAVIQYTSPESLLSWSTPPHGILAGFFAKHGISVERIMVGPVLRAVGESL